MSSRSMQALTAVLRSLLDAGTYGVAVGDGVAIAESDEDAVWDAEDVGEKVDEAVALGGQ